jgi:hypothetical protein
MVNVLPTETVQGHTGTLLYLTINPGMGIMATVTRPAEAEIGPQTITANAISIVDPAGEMIDIGLVE